MRKSFLIVTQMKRLVQLFSKKYCGICEDVHYQLLKLQEGMKFDLQIVDVELKENKAYLRKYYNDIPVIHLDQELIMKHGIDCQEFTRIFHSPKSNIQS
jgi:predicted thioredoxin/glutaredoxin